MKCTCKQCGKEFELAESEIEFYKSKHLSLPKRCKECREKNREEKHSEVNLNNRGNHYSHQGMNLSSNRSRKRVSLVMAVIFMLILIASYFGPKFTQPESSNSAASNASVSDTYSFRNQETLQEHYKKHGIDMGFTSEQEYQTAAAEVVVNPDALHKTEAEDGDDVYYVERTNEFVIVSTDGYLRTYFNPEDGIDYYNRQ